MASPSSAFIIASPLRAVVAAGRPAAVAAASRAGVVCKARPPPAGGRAKRAAGAGRKRRASDSGGSGGGGGGGGGGGSSSSRGRSSPTPGPGTVEGASASAAPRAAGEASTGQQAPRPTPPPLVRAMAATQGESVEATLERDLAGFRSRQRRREGKDDSEDDAPVRASTLERMGKAVTTLLVVDFFVVCFFLVWLVVALVPHFTSHNEVLLDAWLSMWGVVIQPLLGVLMAGTIVSGTLSYVQSKEDITSM
ncbi:hypothetical protein MMPV_008022 [Pyropia vietnamensis]